MLIKVGNQLTVQDILAPELVAKNSATTAFLSTLILPVCLVIKSHSVTHLSVIYNGLKPLLTILTFLCNLYWCWNRFLSKGVLRRNVRIRPLHITFKIKHIRENIRPQRILVNAGFSDFLTVKKVKVEALQSIWIYWSHKSPYPLLHSPISKMKIHGGVNNELLSNTTFLYEIAGREKGSYITF